MGKKKAVTHWWFQRYIITYANTAIAFLIGPLETPVTTTPSPFNLSLQR
jgi:hypothetical protein